jgi:hypothetical protein
MPASNIRALQQAHIESINSTASTAILVHDHTEFSLATIELNVRLLVQMTSGEFSMPRYFVRLRDGDALLPDDGEAQDFANLEAVRREATEGARQLLSHAALSGKAGSLRLQIEAQDENGCTVLTAIMHQA